MNSSRSQNPFLLVLLTVGLLGLLSLLKPGLTVGGVELRPVRLLADVLRKDPTALARLDAPPPNGPAASNTPAAANQLELARADSAAARDARDTTETKVTKGPTVPNLGGLSSFFAALHQTKADGSQVRIAYFGDSMIEGDLITGDLRNSLQTTFGGSGVGFVPMTSITADFRATIHQTFSPDWYEYNLVSDKLPAKYPLGISGHAFVPREVANRDSTGIVADTSWVQFQAGQYFATNRRFVEAKLFYGPGSGRDQVLVTTDGHRVPHALVGQGRLNEMVLHPGTPARRMRLAFATHAPRPVYGVSFESPQGVVLDNFSFRGNSGMSLTRIPAQQLQAFGTMLDYRLVILHYGVNVADARNKTYGWYERAMTRVVDRMQRAFPNASILIIGMSDKSSRIDGEFQTDPSVPRLLKAQRSLAEHNHAAFWNLFEAMGGENSMVKWVEDSPPLANKDYTHVNSRGAHKIAGLLFDYLMQEYAHPTLTDAPAAATRSDSTTRPARDSATATR
ncbi:MAG: GDSL-type esterase/lipase family protein [Janthinobacterium lividum]